MRRFWIVVALLAACHRQGDGDCDADASTCDLNTQVSWVESFGWEWNAFNHRLSAMHVVATEDGVEAGVVGGASTTGHVFDDDGTCVNADTCWELPTYDSTLFSATRARAVSDVVLLAQAEVTLDASAEGVETTVEVALPRAALSRDAVAAWIGGLSLGSALAEASQAAPASCYDPRHGWLPSSWRLSVTPGSLSADGRTARVSVSTAFTAGESRETQRACYDALRAAAALRVTVQVVVAVGDVTTRPVQVREGVSWESGREEQPLSDIGVLEASLDPAAMIGWSSLDLRFHQSVDPGRGAYLRGLALIADPELGQAYGYATNQSLTALSGFDFAFAGTVAEVSSDAEVERSTWGLDEMPAELDPVDQTPVWRALEPAP